MPTRTLKQCCRVALYAVLGSFFTGVMAAANALPPWNLPGFRASSAPLNVQPGTLPTLAAEALDGTPITLPTGLAGQRNLLLLSWARDQSPQLETWTAVAQALQHTQFDFRIYHLPVSAPENFIYRWWDTASLRAAETDPEQLHWSIPLYTDKAQLHQAVGGSPSEEHAILVLLVDRGGHILWKAQGPSTAATRASLLTAARDPR